METKNKTTLDAIIAGEPAPTPIQKPSIGRIVHYREPSADKIRAAIVTVVWSDTCVNLHVFGECGAYDVRSSSAGVGPGNWSWPERV